MKIIFDHKLKRLALELGGKHGLICIDSGSEPEMTKIKDEEVLFVGREMANKHLRKLSKYPKCWEVGRLTDNIDYLRRIILNTDTLEKDSNGRQHKNPEKIIAQRFDFDCGWGAVCTLLLMIGREDLLKKDLYKILEVNPTDGTKSQNIKKFFEGERIPYLEIWKASLNDLENIVNNNGVALISYQTEGTEEEMENLLCGHYSIVFDIDEEYVWLIDPSWDMEYTPGLGKGVVRIKREEFYNKWIDKGSKGEIYDHWLLALRLPVQG